MKVSDKERLKIIKGTPYFISDDVLLKDLKWLIAQAEKVERYEENLEEISSCLDSFYDTRKPSRLHPNLLSHASVINVMVKVSKERM